MFRFSSFSTFEVTTTASMFNMKSSFCFLALFCLWSLVNSAPVDNLDAEWEKFKIEYKRNYNATEEIQRRELFKKTVNEIEAHNKKAAQGLVSYTLGINQFADWTDDERKRMLSPKDSPHP